MPPTRLLLVLLSLAGCAAHHNPSPTAADSSICVNRTITPSTQTWDCADQAALNLIAPLVYQDQE